MFLYADQEGGAVGGGAMGWAGDSRTLGWGQKRAQTVFPEVLGARPEANLERRLHGSGETVGFQDAGAAVRMALGTPKQETYCSFCPG